MAVFRNKTVVDAYKFDGTIDFVNKLLMTLSAKGFINNEFTLKLEYSLYGVSRIIFNGFDCKCDDYVILFKSHFEVQAEDQFLKNFEHIN